MGNHWKPKAAQQLFGRCKTARLHSLPQKAFSFSSILEAAGAMISLCQSVCSFISRSLSLSLSLSLFVCACSRACTRTGLLAACAVGQNHNRQTPALTLPRSLCLCSHLTHSLATGGLTAVAKATFPSAQRFLNTFNIRSQISALPRRGGRRWAEF